MVVSDRNGFIIFNTLEGISIISDQISSGGLRRIPVRHSPHLLNDLFRRYTISEDCHDHHLTSVSKTCSTHHVRRDEMYWVNSGKISTRYYGESWERRESFLSSTWQWRSWFSFLDIYWIAEKNQRTILLFLTWRLPWSWQSEFGISQRAAQIRVVKRYIKNASWNSRRMIIVFWFQ